MSIHDHAQQTARPRPIRQFRLTKKNLADLNLIAKHHATESGEPCSRSDAIRLAVQREADRVRKLRK